MKNRKSRPTNSRPQQWILAALVALAILLLLLRLYVFVHGRHRY
ncbi:MAG: hypothetical protein ABR956_16950 [Terracidiphilus sp.]